MFEHIKKLSTANPHAEYYLTDMAEVLRQARQRVVVWKTENAVEVLGANTRAELSFIDYQMRMRKCHELMAEGVTIFYPATCVIDGDVEIATDTVIEPFVQIFGRSRIGSGCRIRSYSVIRDSEMADGVLIRPGCILEEPASARRHSRSLFPSAPRQRHRRGSARRQFCRDQEDQTGQGIKGQPPYLSRRRRNRRGRQHRRRNHHLQLRRRSQARHRHRRRRLHRQRQHPGRAPPSGQRRLRGRRLLYHRRCPSRCTCPRPRPQIMKEGWAGAKRSAQNKIKFTFHSVHGRPEEEPSNKKAPRPGFSASRASW